MLPPKKKRPHQGAQHDQKRTVDTKYTTRPAPAATAAPLALLGQLLAGRDLLPADLLSIPHPWRSVLALLSTAAQSARLAVLDRLTSQRRDLRAAIEPYLPELIALAQIGGVS